MMSKRAAATLALALCAAQGFAFELQGHRGARGLAPENTVEGFALTLGIGVTTLETDIAITRDGVLAIHHDRRLSPDTARRDGAWLDGEGPAIHSMSWEEVRKLDVGRLKPGTRYASLYPEQVPVDGARIPRIEEMFALVKKSGNATVGFAIETKLSPLAPDETPAPEPFAQAVVAAIRAAGMEKRSQILSFDWRTLQVVQKIAPEIPTVYLTLRRGPNNNVDPGGGESRWTAGFQLKDHGSVPKMIKAAGGAYWSAFFRDLDAAQVREAQSLGLKVLAWTVNERDDMERLLDMKVDGIVTDRPDRLREAMAKRGMPLPAPTPVKP